MTTYIALMRKEADSDFSVDFPDFPGCVTAGETLDGAKDLATEALAIHIRGMQEDGEMLPNPSNLDTIMADVANKDAAAFLVNTPARREKAVRVQFTIAPSVLAEIDATAAAEHTTRSAFLADAALRAIHAEK